MMQQTLPAPPAKKSRKGWWIAGAIAALFVLPATFGGADPAPSYDAPGVEEVEITAAMVVDVMDDTTIANFCAAYFNLGDYDMAYAAFADGYGTQGPPYASEVFDEVITRC